MARREPWDYRYDYDYDYGYGYGYDDYYGYGRRPSPYPPRTPDFLPVAAAVTPIVNHGLRELQEGRRPVEHILYEVASGGYLVGMGYPAPEAIAIVEEWERRYGWSITPTPYR